MSRYLRRVLFREPLGASVPWFMLVAGCFSLLIGSFMIILRSLTFLSGWNSVALGLMLVLLGVSEILPKERKTAIMSLRQGSLVSLPIVIIVSMASVAVEMAKA